MQISGIVPPLVTPLLQPGSLSTLTIDQEGLERLISRQLSADVHGVFVLGTTGEGPSLSGSLRRQMVESSSTLLADRVPLYVGITDTSLRDAIALGEYAADQGAAAAVAAPPFYFPAGQTELCHWFTLLADALPLPLLLYNMPSCTKIAIESDCLETLIQHPNIVGLKDSSGDLQYLEAAIQLAGRMRPDWPVLIGPEALLTKAMELGAVGGVTGGANLAPQLFTELFAAKASGDAVRTERLQRLVVELQDLYSFGKYGSSYLKGLKCALELTGVCSGVLAAPFDPFKPRQRSLVQEWLEQFEASEYLPDLLQQ